jgi:hypothetical protein
MIVGIRLKKRGIFQAMRQLIRILSLPETDHPSNISSSNSSPPRSYLDKHRISPPERLKQRGAHSKALTTFSSTTFISKYIP